MKYPVSISFMKLETKARYMVQGRKEVWIVCITSFSHSYIVTSFPSIGYLFILKQCFLKGDGVQACMLKKSGDRDIYT